MNITFEMSLQLGGLCFILLCHFLAVSTNGIHENVRSEEVIIEFYRTLTLHCNATEVPGATVVWRREGEYPAITLVNSNKYVIEETQLDEQTTLMQLTVRNVEPADYLIYSCSSNNLLGGFNVDRKLRNQSIEHLL
ncbi:hypothetical protein B566_EDAN013416 [Ephemera danica]|nr:hypothetical protein B566_EDAN013416 [Ephemera danica]